MPNPQVSDYDTSLWDSGSNRRTNQPPLLNLLVDNVRIQPLGGFPNPPISPTMGAYPILCDTVCRTTVVQEEIHRVREGEVEMIVEIKVGMDILTSSSVHALPKRVR